MQPQRRILLTQIGALAAPVMLVGLMHLGMTPLVAPSSGGPSDSPMVVPVNTAASVETPDQKRASEWVRSIIPATPLPSPLDHPIIVRAAPVKPTIEVKRPDPPPIKVPTVDPVAGLSLTATMRVKDGGAVALINSRVYKVGQDVMPGCPLESVDVKLNQVEIRMPDGRLIKLARAH